MAKTMVCVDADILIKLFRNPSGPLFSKLQKLKSEGKGVAIPTIAYYEYMRGTTGGNTDPTKRELDLLKILHVVGAEEYLDFTKSSAEKASIFYNLLRKSGCHIGSDFDILIAACTFEKEYELFTDNKKHYQKMIGLKLFDN